MQTGRYQQNLLKFPNFESFGYQVKQQLGHNYQGGRVTYQAINLATKITVVIKQFRFATTNSDWSDCKAVEREIQVLRSLNHSGIPRYLDSFDSGDGICLVQEYKNAQPLSTPRSFAPEEIKEIAVKILEILVYLQERIPPVFHRDLKPENILVDEQLNVYLVDFGFARIGGGSIAASSIYAGTFGFMAPEQLYDRELTKAADLYGLGATLICLLTQTKSTRIGELINLATNQINFQHLVSQLSFRFIEWLENLVQPDPEKRFPSAEVALAALQPLYVIRTPEVELSATSLEFEAQHIGEKLTKTLTVSNSIPETLLEGNWQVAPHSSDPPHSPDYHCWISFHAHQFKSNSVQCKIQIDTSKLKADKVYRRVLLLQTNANNSPEIVTVKVKTAPLPIANQKLPWLWLLMLLTFSAFGAYEIKLFSLVFPQVMETVKNIWLGHFGF
ncbi:MAG: serine/threonine-protein kinase [Oscillatoria sp. PMC 1068.18]|nr:serine/threonine-protein kinase [Oscillatoria sp. PMC 1068.18]